MRPQPVYPDFLSFINLQNVREGYMQIWQLSLILPFILGFFSIGELIAYFRHLVWADVEAVILKNIYANPVSDTARFSFVQNYFDLA
jgi:hypothetical protein